MKTTIFSIIFLVCFAGVASAQTTDKLQLDESARVEVQRSIISKELIQLRDSLGVTIKAAAILASKAKDAAKKTQYENANTTLTEYQNRVKSDLQETSLTAKNAWTGESEKRIRISMNDTRREYNRIRIDILH